MATKKIRDPLSSRSTHPNGDPNDEGAAHHHALPQGHSNIPVGGIRSCQLGQIALNTLSYGRKLARDQHVHIDVRTKEE